MSVDPTPVSTLIKLKKQIFELEQECDQLLSDKQQLIDYQNNIQLPLEKELREQNGQLRRELDEARARSAEWEKWNREMKDANEKVNLLHESHIATLEAELAKFIKANAEVAHLNAELQIQLAEARRTK